jgi:hypothetical protein
MAVANHNVTLRCRRRLAGALTCRSGHCLAFGIGMAMVRMIVCGMIYPLEYYYIYILYGDGCLLIDGNQLVEIFIKLRILFTILCS